MNGSVPMQFRSSRRRWLRASRGLSPATSWDTQPRSSPRSERCIGASPAVVTNAGIAAVLIATVQAEHGGYSPAAARRLVDVLIGGATGLAVLVLLPSHI